MDRINPYYSGVSQRALKLRQAATYLGVSTVSIRRLIKRGLIKPNRALRHILISIAELDRFLEEGQQ
jgi:excisionase family DNA binding protein